jgi:hypothetical protein
MLFNRGAIRVRTEFGNHIGPIFTEFPENRRQARAFMDYYGSTDTKQFVMQLAIKACQVCFIYYVMRSEIMKLPNYRNSTGFESLDNVFDLMRGTHVDISAMKSLCLPKQDPKHPFGDPCASRVSLTTQQTGQVGESPSGTELLNVKKGGGPMDPDEIDPVGCQSARMGYIIMFN